MKEYLRDIITNFSAKTLREADRLLKLNYETVFKIRNHKLVGEIPDVLSYHSGRSAGGHESMIKAIKSYDKFRIYDIAKISFWEYLEIPRPMLETFQRECLAIAEERDKNEAARRKMGNDMFETQLRQLQQGGGQLPPQQNPSAMSMK